MKFYFPQCTEEATGRLVGRTRRYRYRPTSKVHVLTCSVSHVLVLPVLVHKRIVDVVIVIPTELLTSKAFAYGKRLEKIPVRYWYQKLSPRYSRTWTKKIRGSKSPALIAAIFEQLYIF